jgi:tagatose 1,6-diphosphate aldolase
MSQKTSDQRGLDPVARALGSLAHPGGGISTLALDHRDAMRNAYRRAGLADVEEATMLETKARIVDALGDCGSSILLDAAALERCRRPGMAVLMPLEEQGHEEFAGGRLNQLLDDFAPVDAANLDVQGCKLLLYFRADHELSASRQLGLVRTLADDCHRHGLALVVEPKVYRLSGESEAQFAGAFGDLVVAGARDLSESGADLLKIEYPGSGAACERVTEALSSLPWTLLGGSDVDGDTFAEQLRAACAAGASGFIAGRAIWGGALACEEAEQAAWLREHALPLFERLVEITDTYARRLN